MRTLLPLRTCRSWSARLRSATGATCTLRSGTTWCAPAVQQPASLAATAAAAAATGQQAAQWQRSRGQHQALPPSQPTRQHSPAVAHAPCPCVALPGLALQRHAGAKITGEWSRYDLMTRPNDFARGAIAAVGATLPPTAHSLYYRDAIGNISSSGGLGLLWAGLGRQAARREAASSRLDRAARDGGDNADMRMQLTRSVQWAELTPAPASSLPRPPCRGAVWPRVSGCEADAALPAVWRLGVAVPVWVEHAAAGVRAQGAVPPGQGASGGSMSGSNARGLAASAACCPCVAGMHAPASHA